MPLFGFRTQQAEDPLVEQDEEEQVSRMIQTFLNNQDPIAREEILRERANLDNTSFSFFRNFIDIIGFGLFPILLARVIKNLLSAVAFSSDIIQDIFEYYYSTSYTKDNLILKFSQIIMYELGKTDQSNFVKLLTIGVYIGYSVLVSSYMIFTFVFYFLCLVLTTTRRWSEIDKFLVNVFKSSNGVF